MAISIKELHDLKQPTPKRIKIEESLRKIVASDLWVTSKDMQKYLQEIGISESESVDEIIKEGGYLWCKRPFALLAGTEMAEIHDQVVEMGRLVFVNRIDEIKRFWIDDIIGSGE